ncbi:AGE family epimerase/isomerase [Rhizobium sp. BK376]|uniref:AGE family epimerase/isomerase n=1 Tax=Rhizobium sp. BK376 TaxID=2512149 RepID=UPI0010538681|nr:AGE family epimerase/isomerase [Rhizobium sp. BK376]TCR79510.1 mannose-6-phosphate isomerase type 3 [Rhizobium sp. BK376]
MKRSAMIPVDTGSGKVEGASSPPPLISNWLTERFLPAWSKILTQRESGFPEEIDARGLCVDTGQRSTMVTARLVYTLCLCHELDPNGRYLDAAKKGYAFMLDGRLDDGTFPHRLPADSQAFAQRADLYDSAFILLALGAFARIAADPRSLQIAREVAGHIDGPYLDDGAYVGEPCLQLQFPYMHLFEACELLARLDPVGDWARRSRQILDLLERRLVLPSGAIAEKYDRSWSLPQDTGQVQIEIGHQFEWAWLLYRHSAMTRSSSAKTLADGLFDFAMQTISWSGSEINPFPNGVNPDGKPTSDERPLWPATEMLRASTLRDRLDGGPSKTSDAIVRFLFRHYLNRETLCWANDLGAIHGKPPSPMPTRVLYHLIPSLAAYAQTKEAAFATSLLLEATCSENTVRPNFGDGNRLEGDVRLSSQSLPIA